MEVNFLKIREEFLAAYNSAKIKAQIAIDSAKWERALRKIEYASAIAWHNPILEEFIDDELEAMLSRIASQLIEPVHLPTLSKQQKRAVFYNGQIVDTGGLTEQYLDFLVANDYEVLFVVSDIKNTVLGQRILLRLEENIKTHVVILEHGSKLQKIRQLHQLIVAFDPDFSFLHFLPNDVVGFAVYIQITGRPRYYIVHNDHTFWLGKSCSDYFLEFRQLGVKTSIEKRGIAEVKIINVPYYPINSGVPFQGFPFDPEGKVVGLTGALLAKYFRDPELEYFEHIKNLINVHPDFIFCLCGPGTVEQVHAIQSFIDRNDLGEQFYYLGKRSDFYALVGEIDILFESYPQRGGLTVLFATNQNKAVVGMAAKSSESGTTEGFLDVTDYHQPLTWGDFEKEASRLITDRDYRENNASKFSRISYNKVSFDAKLKEVIREGFLFRDVLRFNQHVETPSLSSYKMLFTRGQTVSEFLCRAKCDAFIDTMLCRRLIILCITIYFNGIKVFLRKFLGRLKEMFS